MTRIRNAWRLAAALAASAAPALASTWVNVGRNSNGSAYDIDMEGLTRQGSSVTFQLRVHYGPNGPTGSADGYVARRQANCTDHSFHDLQTDYTKDGDVLKSLTTSVRTTSPARSAGATVDSSSTEQYKLRGTAICSGTVELPPPPTATGGGNGPTPAGARFGGALGAALLLPLFGPAALRRRRK